MDFARSILAAVACVAPTACGDGGRPTGSGTNSLLVSALLVFDRSYGNERIQSSRSGDKCTLRLGTETTTLSTDDISAVLLSAPLTRPRRGLCRLPAAPPRLSDRGAQQTFELTVLEMA